MQRESNVGRATNALPPQEHGTETFDTPAGFAELSAEATSANVNHFDFVPGFNTDAVLLLNPAGKVVVQNPSGEVLMHAIAANAGLRETFANVCKNPAGAAEPQMVEHQGCLYTLQATPMYMAGRKLIGYTVIFRDITALMQSERRRDEIIMQLSHELRTPLAAARGYIDLMEVLDGASLSKQARNFLDYTISSLSLLEGMVNQVIDMSTIVSNRLVLKKERLDLSDLVQRRVEHWFPKLQTRNINTQFYLTLQVLPIDGDEQRLTQVLDHVLSNAYNYTLPGGCVRVHVDRNKHYATVSVVDTGVGIDQDEIAHVFDRMYRGRSASAGETDARGLGLGLYLTKQIVEAHQGTISLESAVGRGTMVTIMLPLDQQQTDRNS
jgi:signal transduction histidine kinase